MKSKLIWLLYNSIELALVILGTIYSKVWAGRLATFWIIIGLALSFFFLCFRGFMSLVVYLAKKSDSKKPNEQEAAKKVTEAYQKFKETVSKGSAAKWINFLVDLTVLVLCIAAGWWFTGFCKLWTMIFEWLYRFDPESYIKAAELTNSKS